MSQVAVRLGVLLAPLGHESEDNTVVLGAQRVDWRESRQSRDPLMVPADLSPVEFKAKVTADVARLFWISFLFWWQESQMLAIIFYIY